MKYGKLVFGALLIMGAASAAVYRSRTTDAPAKPAAWMVSAAIALNRDAIAMSPHGTAAQPAAEQAYAAIRAARAGEQLRVQRRFAEAAAAFREAVEADPMDADSWADLADCQAAAAGHDLTAGRAAILRALRIDPRHRKALWLRASLELQERSYAAAAATWRELRPLVPAGSGDARVIDANIAEADALAGAVGVADGRGG